MTRIGIIGAGVVGSRVVRHLGAGNDSDISVFDIAVASARAVARSVGGAAVDDVSELATSHVVVLCSPAPHAPTAARLLSTGVAVVSVSDDADDVDEMLELETLAIEHEVPLVVGAAMSPGLTGVLARHLADRLAVFDEIHIAMHGTGGPACARQHHDVLSGRALGWHDGAWLAKASGSGRELCWFPDPIGPRDCYRATVSDPVLLRREFPSVDRITARVSATRRDRLTAHLPMLAPPHRRGDVGAVRVEVRGGDASGARVSLVAGAAGPTAWTAGAVAAVFAELICSNELAPGVCVPGSAELDNDDVLRRLVDHGVHLSEFAGIGRNVTA